MVYPKSYKSCGQLRMTCQQSTLYLINMARTYVLLKNKTVLYVYGSNVFYSHSKIGLYVRGWPCSCLGDSAERFTLFSAAPPQMM